MGCTTIFKDREISVTINSTHFDDVSLSLTPCYELNFNMLVTNSIFTNRSSFTSTASGDLDGVRHLKVEGCIFSNSELELAYINSNVTIEDSIVMNNTTSSNGFNAHFLTLFAFNSNVVMVGNVQFLIGSSDDPAFQFLFCNVTITGDVTFANNKPTPITAYSSTCLLYTSPSPRDATLSRMPSSA